MAVSQNCIPVARSELARVVPQIMGQTVLVICQARVVATNASAVVCHWNARPKMA